MDDFTRFCQEVKYKLEKGKIYSYFIQDDFSHNLHMIEIVDNKGNVTWNYFNKTSGMQQTRGV